MELVQMLDGLRKNGVKVFLTDEGFKVLVRLIYEDNIKRVG